MDNKGRPRVPAQEALRTRPLFSARHLSVRRKHRQQHFHWEFYRPSGYIIISRSRTSATRGMVRRILRSSTKAATIETNKRKQFFHPQFSGGRVATTKDSRRELCVHTLSVQWINSVRSHRLRCSSQESESGEKTLTENQIRKCCRWHQQFLICKLANFHPRSYSMLFVYQLATTCSITAVA